MNRSLLVELQSQRIYPSITVLLNTSPALPLSPTHIATAKVLVDQVEHRLANESDIPRQVRASLLDTINELLRSNQGVASANALALCVSPTYHAAIQLGRSVAERVIIDDTFATRDLVADLNRTALYRVITISDRVTRLLVGDRQRLVEERSEQWPLNREPEQSAGSWNLAVMHALRSEQHRHPLPTVVAGVQRSVRQMLSLADLEMIGAIAGNHDKTSWFDLHQQAWPLVTDWLRDDHERAMQQLETARSQKRYAGGLHEIWTLANEGRVDLLVVEDSYAEAVRIVDGQLEITADREAPDVVDDIVDDVIEIVINNRGRVVIVGDGQLVEHGRSATEGSRDARRAPKRSGGAQPPYYGRVAAIVRY